MTPKKQLAGMKTKEMIKCDACDQYHPVEDCEVVIIKMIKGKDCELRPVSSSSSYSFDKRSIISNDTKVEPRVHLSEQEQLIEDMKNAATAKPRPVIIPREFQGMNIPPDDPRFESHGAKAVRRA
jgi:hypothetical protein